VAAPLGPIGRSGDIAKIAVFLASDESGWVSAARIEGAGGHTRSFRGDTGQEAELVLRAPVPQRFHQFEIAGIELFDPSPLARR